MFVRKKKNKSGKTSIQVIDKSQGAYKVIRTIGCSDNTNEIIRLIDVARNWIKEYTGIIEIDFSLSDQLTSKVLNSITSMNRIGYDLLLGGIFDEIGFNKIKDAYFRELVLARVAFPKSKLKTTEYLYRYKQIDWDEDQLYRYLDKLHDTQKDLVQQISYQHTLQIEKPFRIAKTDLKIRPIYHRLQRRIEAHICISFAAYKLYKELERQLHYKKANISATTAIEIAENIFEINAQIKESSTVIKKLLLLTEEQKYLQYLFNF